MRVIPDGAYHYTSCTTLTCSEASILGTFANRLVQRETVNEPQDIEHRPRNLGLTASKGLGVGSESAVVVRHHRDTNFALASFAAAR
jgi:hypothetical protein